MNPNDLRFDNVLGEEYDILKLAYPHYDELQRRLSSVIADHHKDRETETIKVLEIGCGTGITTKFLLDCDPRITITAIDNDKKMLEQIKENLETWNVKDRVLLVEAEVGAYLTSVSDFTFDAVASSFVLHNLELNFRQKVISEIFKVLKTGGIFVNGDKYANDDPKKRAEIYKEQIARYDIFDTINRSDYKKEWVEHMDRDEKEDLVFFEGEAKKYMEKVGFREVKTNYREMMEAIISGIKE